MLTVTQINEANYVAAYADWAKDAGPLPYPVDFHISARRARELEAPYKTNEKDEPMHAISKLPWSVSLDLEGSGDAIISDFNGNSIATFSDPRDAEYVVWLVGERQSSSNTSPAS